MKKEKPLAIGSILAVAISFFMMVDTKYHPALGDYIIDGIGLDAWSGVDKGFHLTIIYFFVPFLLGWIELNRYYRTTKGGKFKAFVIIGLLITAFTVGLNGYTEITKASSDGIKSVAFYSDESKYHYRANGSEITEFRGKVHLENFSKAPKSFYLKLRHNRKGGLYDIYGSHDNLAYTDGGKEPLLITLDGKETRILEVNFLRKPNQKTEFHGSGNGTVTEVIISNGNQEILLSEDNFYGLSLKR